MNPNWCVRKSVFALARKYFSVIPVQRPKKFPFIGRCTRTGRSKNICTTAYKLCSTRNENLPLQVTQCYTNNSEQYVQVFFFLLEMKEMKG